MILALDSSTEVLSLAVGRSSERGPIWVATRQLSGGGRHGGALPAAIADLLAEAGAVLDDLRDAAVGLGPGSFTGLRVGLATVQGLSYARGWSLAGVSSLRALAHGALRAQPTAGEVVALLDARHGQLYAGRFAGPRAEPVGAEVALFPNALAGWLGPAKAQVALIGAGVAAHRAALSADFTEGQLGSESADHQHPDARQVGALCWPLPVASRTAVLALAPHYVRPSEAELKFPEGNFRPRG